jgi:hypothetical protein
VNEKAEDLKRGCIESSISLVESFAKQAQRALERGEEPVAQRAEAYVERFWKQAMEVIDTLENPAEAEAYRRRLHACSRAFRE